MMNKKAVKVFAFEKFFTIGFPAFVVCLLLLWALTLVLFLGGATDTISTEWVSVIFIASTSFAVIILALCAVKFCQIYTVVTIDENGIKKALFKKCFEREIKWDELQELRVVKIGSTLISLLFASTDSLEGLDYKRIKKHRGTIQIPFCKKTIIGIREHSELSIINLSKQEEMAFID